MDMMLLYLLVSDETLRITLSERIPVETGVMDKALGYTRAMSPTEVRPASYSLKDTERTQATWQDIKGVSRRHEAQARQRAKQAGKRR